MLNVFFKVFLKYYLFNLLAEFMFAGKSVWITILSETFDIFTLGQTSQQKFYQTHLVLVHFWSSALALMVSPRPRVRAAG